MMNGPTLPLVGIFKSAKRIPSDSLKPLEELLDFMTGDNNKQVKLATVAAVSITPLCTAKKKFTVTKFNKIIN